MQVHEAQAEIVITKVKRTFSSAQYQSAETRKIGE